MVASLHTTPMVSEKLRSSTPLMRYAQMSVDDTVADLQTTVEGLVSHQEVVSRRLLHGVNELSSDEQELLVAKFLLLFYQDPLILLLVGLAAVLFWMGNVDDAVLISLAITIVVLVGFVQEYRLEQLLQALNRLVPAEAHLTRNGQTLLVLALALVPGDLVHFSQGDRIPADVRLTLAVHLTIDELNLTGENVPVRKLERAVCHGDCPVSERALVAFMGTLVRDGHGSGIVVGTGEATEFGAVFSMMLEIEKPKTPLQQAMDKLGRELLVFSFGVIGVICLLGVAQGRAWLDMFQISVLLAVAAIPEGLPIIVTVTLALGVLRMAKRKAIVRRLPSVETLGSVNVICSDKTGTLTQNHMTVVKAWAFDAHGMYNLPYLVVERLDDALLRRLLLANLQVMFEVGNLCNNARYLNEKERYLGNPLDIALLECLPHFGIEDTRGTRLRVAEVPFLSEKKYMAVCTHQGDKNRCESYVKGATEAVLELCSRFLDESGQARRLTDDARKQIEEHTQQLASEGLRVLAFARNTAKLEDGEEPQDCVFCGVVGMKDPPRPNVALLVSQLMKGGVHVIMITGDSPTTASNIARQIGIPVGEHLVMTGRQLEGLDEEALARAIHNVLVFARTTPEHKVSIVKALQRRGDVVAMTGDGVNDAPALKLADIGIAMGKNGTDVAKEAADMVLTDDDFSTILSAIEEGKGIFFNIQNFVTFQLLTLIAALTLIALATLFGLPNPLNAMQILWINILMDGPPAQLLGVEPVDHEVMGKPPRKRNDKILTRAVIKRVLLSAGVIIVGTLYVFVKEMRDGKVTARDTTMTFTCFVLFDMFNALACRHYLKLIFHIGLGNRMFNLAVAGLLVGQVCAIYVPFFQRVFQTEPLSLGDLVGLTLITSTVFWADEARKYLLRRRTYEYSYTV